MKKCFNGVIVIKLEEEYGTETVLSLTKSPFLCVFVDENTSKVKNKGHRIT